MNSRDRPRQPPPSDPRRGTDARNGAGDGSMSRAEKFEDEKKRIIQSCYSKKEADGTLVESYITHVRITEDSTHPSGPAPPDSASSNKKPRVIIVSVRRSGRVRMHKARENNDGTFSIGKTWMLDDLSSIQSYDAFVPRTPLEQQQKEWASNVGFVVTVGKPYYWHARSAKEKEFFIGSLVKIYKKYTGGKVPNLIGFDERERQSLAGGGPSSSPSVQPVAPSAPAARPPAPTAAPSAPTRPTEPPAPPSAPTAAPSAPIRPSALSARPSQEAVPPTQPSSAYGSREPSRDGPREIRRKPSEDPTLRPKKSREQISRPSTGSKAAPSPFGAPPNAPSPTPALRTEARPKDLHPAFRTADEGSLLSSQEDVRSTLPRTDEVGFKSQPTPAATPPVEVKAPFPKRSADELRPTTPAGPPNGEPRSKGSSPARSPGRRSPHIDAVEKVPAAEKHPQPLPDSVSQETLPPTETVAEPKQVAPVPDRSSPPIPVEPEVAAAVMAVDEPSKPSAEVPAEQSSPAPTEPTEEDADDHRPGLGPMVKKKSTREIAGAFRKAANAYAGERLMAAAKKQKAEGVEPDGITGVVPAPSLNRAPQEPSKSPVEELADKESSAPAVVSPPTFEITQPAVEEASQAPMAPVAPTPDPEKILPPPEQSQESLSEIPQVKDRSRTPSPAGHGRRKRREDHTIKYCQALGIEPSALDGRGIEFDEILTDLGWNGRLGDEKKIEDLEADVRREIGRVEATSWLGNLEQQEGKVEQLAVLIDKTIEECEELDGLLTLYSHELNTLHEDVSYIEAQSQGLQVQTANQKLLQNELQNLLRTLSISTSDIHPLKHADLNDNRGLQDAEHAISILYKAMLMIDADIGQNKKRLVDASVGVYANTAIGQMRAIKEKKEEYHSAAIIFLERLKKFMGIVFQNAKRQIESRADQDRQSQKDPLKLEFTARQNFRSSVWRFNPMMLFAREVSMSEWHGLVHLYEQSSKSFFQNEFRDNGMAWKHTARKPTGEEQELLFTHQEKEKEPEGITMAARKLTVRRGKTVRAATGLRLQPGEKKQGKVEPCEAFAGTLREMLNMISEEQNFVVHFFHLDSLANADYADLVASVPPNSRQCPDFSVKQSHDPDRGMAKRVEQIMDEVYSFWPNEMQAFVDWAVQADPLQGIGILFALESAMTDLDDTNQEFIIHSLQKVHSRLMGLFNRFVDEQIRGIEDTKVKVNKRKGVISFMRVFPNFSTAVENMLTHPSGEFCDIRVGVNDAYDRINRAMWESLKFIAKEAPGQPPGVAANAGDPEDKEVLNYHILLIENMNHYVEEVDVHNLPVLERWVDRARQDFDEHMRLYLDAVIHRPLGKLLDFLQSIETLQANGNPTDVATRASHSRIVAKKVLSTYDVKEVRRGVEMLKKRVEKHFGDADDPGLSRSLVLKVLRECENRYEDAHDRTRRIIDTVYEGQLELEWRKEDIGSIFRK
ncbi:hypothetical protein N7512_002767 [Penicillium capsulatum]|nr:hypothetical protein N7512_002767 [Penicillium capsulatum]